MNRKLRVVILWAGDASERSIAEKIFHRLDELNRGNDLGKQLHIHLSKIEEFEARTRYKPTGCLGIIPYRFSDQKRTMRPFVNSTEVQPAYAHGARYGVLVSCDLDKKNRRFDNIVSQILVWAIKGITEVSYPWGPPKDPVAAIRRKKKRKENKMNKSFDFSLPESTPGLPWAY